ncbi:OsmC family protein [Pseudonocardia yuanmonensis]|uniref:OsmC family protein n=1 Tax=Pseudonocardia yuanmonensis TaxID=1095914 RepID=A0ABP8W4L0_9PSEU
MTTTSDLRTVLDATAEAVARDPKAAAVTFAADSDLVGVTEVDVHIGKHVVKIDEPEALGGTSLAPNPVEFSLAALGSCQAITYRFWSEKLGIRIDRLHVEVTGDLDVHGVFGLKDGVRAGFGEVDVRVRVSGPEPAERYEQLRAAVNGHCPVLDIFTSPVAVTTSMTTEPSGTTRA